MKKFIEQFKTIKYFTGKNGQFTTHYSLFTKNLVPQCLRAFTLAETLIVIGIIGVVAALTLPNLNHATGDKEKVTKVKKIYSALTDAVDRAQVIYGPVTDWFKGSNHKTNGEICAKRITEFMKVSKFCGQSEGCFANSPLVFLDGHKDSTNYVTILNEHYMVQLADGTSLAFYWGTPICKIKVDIDGPNKGKNQIGNDIFEFNIGLSDDECNNFKYCKLNELTTDGFAGYNGPSDYYGTTTWVIENGNLDYLKCPDELNWETQTSCK